MRKLLVFLLALACVLGLVGCSKSYNERTELPITYFTAYSTIIQTDNDVFLLVNGDSQNFRLWIDSCPIIEEVNTNISENWNYKITFCDTKDIIADDDTYYIPHTASIHIAYINEEESIIQLPYPHSLQSVSDCLPGTSGFHFMRANVFELY